MKIIKHFFLLCCLILPIAIIASDWEKFAQELPSDFKLGAATSAFQIEGAQCARGLVANNWTQDKDLQDFPGGQCWGPQGIKNIIDALKLAGCKEYRFSVSWEKVMPCPNTFDEASMQHYKDLIHALKQNNIEPYVNLFHHTWPTWNGNGFETKEEVSNFIAFGVYVVEQFKDAGVTYWMTFNEPVGYAMQGWFTAKYPPYKKVGFSGTGQVIQHMFDAHVQLYDIIKKSNPEARVGFAKAQVALEAARWWAPHDQAIARYFTYLQNYAPLYYFSTGSFRFGPKLFTNLALAEHLKDGGRVLNYVGINYYGLNRIKNFKQEPVRLTDEQSETGRIIYAQGLEEIIIGTAQTLPDYVQLIIGENGIHTTDEAQRQQYFFTHLQVVVRANKKLENIGRQPISKFHVWTLLSPSGEWPKVGKQSMANSEYGLCQRQQDGTILLREGAHNLARLAQKISLNS